MKLCLLWVVIVQLLGCAGNLHKEVRLKNPDLPNKKGTILLIHGSAPFNEDGNVPDARAGRYHQTNFYKFLSEELEKRSWKVVRYSKPGVYQDHIDFNIYKTTDIKVLGKQLCQVWDTLPKNTPRLVFAWSEGSLHVATLPMNQIDGVVLLGAISTNIYDVMLSQEDNQRDSVENQLKQILHTPRDEMLGLDRPAGRLIDELKIHANWKTFGSLKKNVPMLVLHGELDREVPLSQAMLWKDKLPEKSITLIIGKGKNHILGDGEQNGAKFIANSIDEWWLQRR